MCSVRERGIGFERKVGHHFAFHRLRYLRTQVTAGVLQRRNNRRHILSTQRGDEYGCVFEVRRGPYLRHRDPRLCQNRIAERAAIDDVGQDMAQQLTHTQLPLTWAAIAAPVPVHTTNAFGGIEAPLNRAGNLFHLITFDDIANLNVLVGFERHTAFVTVPNLGHVILEVTQGCELALVNDDIVA